MLNGNSSEKLIQNFSVNGSVSLVDMYQNLNDYFGGKLGYKNIESARKSEQNHLIIVKQKFIHNY